jgi:Tfp pilus assembly protein PilF
MKTDRFKTLFILFPLLTALASCSATKPNEDTLQILCQPQTQLDGMSHYTLLSGGYEALGKNDLNCAERLTLKAREVDPKDPYAALNLGVIYQKQGKNPMARTQYDEAVRLDGSDREKSSESASEASDQRFINRRPGEIAKRNLKTLPR